MTRILRRPTTRTEPISSQAQRHHHHQQHSPPKSLVTRMLGTFVALMVVFTLFSSQKPASSSTPETRISPKDDKDEIQQPSSLLLLSNHIASFVSSSSNEKRRGMFQKKVQKWLLSTTASNSSTKPPDTPGAFIHVSKTGGSTLSTQLRNACHSWVKQEQPCNPAVMQQSGGSDESYVSQLTTYYHIPDFALLANRIRERPDRYEFYVWTVRDPLERTISGFVYQHPDNIQVRKAKRWQRLYQRAVPSYVPCFPTLESFATALGDSPSDYDYPFNTTTVNNTDCTRLARAIMDSKVSIPAHLFHSFNRLRQQGIIPSFGLGDAVATSYYNNEEETIHHFVVRTEHLWNDWTTTNQWLGQGKVATFPDIRERDQSHAADTIDYPVTREISTKGQERLCGALNKEYRAYLQLLQHAANLGDKERQDSLVQARRNCPNLNLQFPAEDNT